MPMVQDEQRQAVVRIPCTLKARKLDFLSHSRTSNLTSHEACDFQTNRQGVHQSIDEHQGRPYRYDFPTVLIDAHCSHETS